MSRLRLPAVTTFGPELLQQAFDALTSWHNSAGQFPVSATPPANPGNGDFWIYPGSGFYWQFVYDTSETTNKWKFIGGPPVCSQVATSESTNSTTFVDLTTTGPSFTVPRAGDYVGSIYFEAFISSGFAGNQGCTVAFKKGSATTVDADGVQLVCIDGAGRITGAASPAIPLSGLSASDVVKLQYRVGGQTFNFALRKMSIVPVRVS